MRKSLLLTATMMLGAWIGMGAQSVGTETEITVTDSEGKQEVIDVPEGMTTDLDELLHLYNAQSYLMKDYRDAL